MGYRVKEWRGLVHGQLLEFDAFVVASLKMCFSPRFYTVIKLQKMHSILKLNKRKTNTTYTYLRFS
jgi:hypothetical protein